MGFSSDERHALTIAAIAKPARSWMGYVAEYAVIALAATDGEHGVSDPREPVAVWVRNSGFLDRFVGVELRRRPSPEGEGPG